MLSGGNEVPETSTYTPAVASFGGYTNVAWTGEGDNYLNVAPLDFVKQPNVIVAFSYDSFKKLVMSSGSSSNQGPSLCSFSFLAI